MSSNAAAQTDIPWYEPLVRLAKATLFLATHTCVALCFIWCIGFVQAALHESGDPKLFHLVPVAFLFDAMDLGVISVYGFFGIRDAARAFR